MSGSCNFISAARRAGLIVVVALALPAAQSALAQQYTVDAARSKALTSYLRRRRLPLVGAQVLKSADGGQRLLLYGFVATNHGKSDAQRKALAYLHAKDIAVENRIAVRPELAKMKAPAPAAETRASEPSQEGGESLDRVLDDIARYGVKSAPDQGGP
ncbi:MAG TPA: hypothetical protein VJ718_11245 [Candidatus Binataceae bacterium]|nr:hypothetical protein [Candidatus Binataceae bacterium]